MALRKRPRTPSLRLRRWTVGILVLWSSLLAAPALAHPLSPSLLELRELGPERLSVQLRTPWVRARGLHPRARLPRHCRRLTDAGSSGGLRRVETGAHVERFEIDCPGGLDGTSADPSPARVGIAGLQAGRDTAIVRVVRLGGGVVEGLVSASQPWLEVPAQRDRLEVAGDYAALGMRHLWLGPDHLLLLAALLLLVTRRRALLLTITAFTVGHSATLVLATLGLVRVPGALAEVAIAATLLAVAVEIPTTRPGAPSARSTAWTRRPWLIAGLFGLVHGLGFAGALRSAGLPGDALPLALVSFNVGVEVAQVLVVAPAILVLWLLRSAPPLSLQAAGGLRLAAAYAIGVPASYWIFQRCALLAQQFAAGA